MLRRLIFILGIYCFGFNGFGQDISYQSMLDSAQAHQEAQPWLARKEYDQLKALVIDEESEFSVNVLYQSGNLHYTSGDKDKALFDFVSSLKLSEKLGLSIYEAKNASMIGELTHATLGDRKSALEYHQRALEIYEEMEDTAGIAGVFNDIGNVTQDLNYHFKSLELDLIINNSWGIADSYHNIASILEKQDQIDSAILYYEKCLELDRQNNGAWAVATSSHSLGRVLIKNNQYKKASKVLLNGVGVAKEGNFKESLAGLYHELSFLEELRSDYQQALVYHKLHKAYTDSLLTDERMRVVAQNVARYDMEKKDLINEKLEKEKDLSDEKLKSQRYASIALFIGAGAFLLLALFMFTRFRTARKQKEIIEGQKSIVDEAFDELEIKNKEILDSINYARRIQNAILPPKKVFKSHLVNSFIIYLPKDIVAGDFYWLEEKNDTVLFAAADCTGHGVPGAMVSVVCNNGLNRAVREYGLTDPGEILNRTREIVINEFEKSEDEVTDGMDIALCTLKGNTLQYAGAHNPLWIIRKGSVEIEEIKANKQPIGKFRNPLPYSTHSLNLSKGDRIYIFSDGYADQFGGEKGKKLKSSYFKKLILSMQNGNMDQQSIRLEAAFEEWKGNLEQLDDVCVIGVQV